MNASKIIGIVLIAASLVAGYFGYNKLSKSTKSVKALNMEVGFQASQDNKRVIYL